MFIRLAIFVAGLALAAQAQTPILTCQATADPIVVRGEGLSERMGDIVLQCTGGVPRSVITGNLTVFLSVPITNRTDASGFSDLLLSVDSGNGFVPANARAAYLNSVSLSFSGLALPLSPSGAVSLRLSNLRGAANQAGLGTLRQITAYLSFNAGALVSFNTNIFNVGTLQRSLYSSSTSPLFCSSYGTSPLSSNSFTGAIASNASFGTIRITEGFPHAFGPHSDFNFVTGDFGTRVIVRFAGVPAGVRLYLPDGIVGTDGLQPTSAGDYGLPPSPGTYVPGSRSLLLLRIATNDIDGGGFGSATLVPLPKTTTSFDTMTEVTRNSDGTAQAVYEVFDANPFAVESATIPSFIYIPANAVDRLTEISQQVLLAPSSTSLGTTPGTPIPRFVVADAPNDCTVVGDCTASYFPHLTLSTKSIDVSMTTLDQFHDEYFVIAKSGAGNYFWNASVRYTGGVTNGYQWLRLTPVSGLNRETPRVEFVPGNLPPGVYDALITVDGGPMAGQAQIAVTLRLSLQLPLPVVTSALNPVSMKAGPLVPGSAVAIMGNRLSGSKVSVTFDGSPAQVLGAASAERVDVLVPDTVAGKASSVIKVAVDGLATNPGLSVPIAPSAPVIFAGSILNSDNTTNSSQNGGLAGTTIQFITNGLPLSGVFTGQISDRVIEQENILFAGPAPGLSGYQLVILMIPADLPSMITGVSICGGASADATVCSDAVDLTIVAVPPPATDPQ